MANQMIGLLGRKIGMTQMFGEGDVIVPVTVVDVTGNAVIATKSADGADGYTAVQLSAMGPAARRAACSSPSRYKHGSVGDCRNPSVPVRYS